MSIEVLVPNLPESVSDATLISWHKQAGDFVNKNENLVDLETDKVVLEVTAPESGVLSQILKENGAIVTGGELLALMESDAAHDNPATANKTASAKAPEQNNEDIPLSPSVRRLINENILDPSVIAGTGKSGRLTKTDVLDHLNKQTPATVKTQKSEPLQATATEAKQEIVKPIEPTGVSSSLRPEQRVAMTRLRAKVAERLLQAQQNAAMLTTFNEVNMQKRH